MTSLLERLADIGAAKALAGVTVHSRRGALLAVEHGVTAAVLPTPPLRRTFAAAVECPSTDYSERLDGIAELAEVDRRWLVGLVRSAPVLADTSGALARQVIAGGERWRKVVGLLVELEELTGGAVLPHLTVGSRQLEAAS